jgi:hypothetical protein|tara:strand:- start:109 stop:678 length:570 start_codon:yes stop_codon:yes gene_type:complete
MRIVDTLIVFRILKLLVTPFNKQKAFKFGFIDKDGKRIKEKIVDGKKVKNNPESKMEKSSLTLLHRLVFNLKRIIEKVPFGKTQFASYAVALLMLKEHCGLSDEQGDELYEKFYRMLKDNELLHPDQIVEAVNFPTLHEGTYHLRHRLDDYKPRTAVQVKGEIDKILGVSVYEGYVGDNRVLLSAEDVY